MRFLKNSFLLISLFLFSFSCIVPLTPIETYVTVKIDENCEGEFNTAMGQLISISEDWESNVFSIHPNEEIQIEVPEEGAYRVFVTFVDANDELRSWDNTVNISEGDNFTITLPCY